MVKENKKISGHEKRGEKNLLTVSRSMFEWPVKMSRSSNVLCPCLYGWLGEEPYEIQIRLIGSTCGVAKVTATSTSPFAVILSLSVYLTGYLVSRLFFPTTRLTPHFLYLSLFLYVSDNLYVYPLLLLLL